MTDEHFRLLERASRSSGDPADLARFVAEAQRRGLDETGLLTSPGSESLLLAVQCGSEAAAVALGAEQCSEDVVCFRSLCRALRLCTGLVGKSARGHLAAALLGRIETASSEGARIREEVGAELLEWTRDTSYARVRQARCMALADRLQEASSEPSALAMGLDRAIVVMTPNNRTSAAALEDLLNLVASGWIEGSKKMRRSMRGERQRLLVQAKAWIEDWAFARVAEERAKPARPPEPEPASVTDGRCLDVETWEPEPKRRRPAPRPARGRTPKAKARKQRSPRRQPRRRGSRRR